MVFFGVLKTDIVQQNYSDTLYVLDVCLYGFCKARNILESSTYEMNTGAVLVYDPEGDVSKRFLAMPVKIHNSTDDDEPQRNAPTTNKKAIGLALEKNKRIHGTRNAPLVDVFIR